jgi:hypothetical protein
MAATIDATAPEAANEISSWPSAGDKANRHSHAFSLLEEKVVEVCFKGQDYAQLGNRTRNHHANSL